jgi:hypothetical protein
VIVARKVRYSIHKLRRLTSALKTLKALASGACEEVTLNRLEESSNFAGSGKISKVRGSEVAIVWTL